MARACWRGTPAIIAARETFSFAVSSEPADPLEHETKRASAQGGALALAERLTATWTGGELNSTGTGIEPNNARERVQQGGLTGTGRTHNRHGFAGVDIEAHVTQNRVLP